MYISNSLLFNNLELTSCSFKHSSVSLSISFFILAFADIGDYLKFGQEEQKVWSMNEDGSFKPVIDPETGEQKIRKYNFVNLHESEEVDTTIISEVSEGKDGVKIKLQDKMRALQWLSDRMDLLPTDTRIKLDNEQKKLDNILH